MVRRIGPKLVLSLLLGGLFAIVLSRSGVPTVPPAASFETVRGWAVPAYVASLLVTHFVRAARWRHLIAPIRFVPLKEVILLNWIGFFAIFALPLRLGEMTRPALTKLRQGIPISVGLGTVAVERVIDGLMTSLCVAWAIIALPRLPTRDPIASSIPSVGWMALLAFSGAFGALGLFLWRRDLAVRLTHRTLGAFVPSLAGKLAEKVGNVADGLASLRDGKLLGRFVSETILYWLSNAFGMWILALGCGLDAHLGHAVAVMGVLAIGILLPAGPGLFGAFQLAIASGLRLYFPESEVANQGAVFIFLMYTSQAVVMILTGALPLYALDLRIGDLLFVPSSPDGAKRRRSRR